MPVANLADAGLPGLVCCYKADGSIFTDTGGTTAVSAHRQKVARWNDYGAGARHATQSIAGQRPYADFQSTNLGRSLLTGPLNGGMVVPTSTWPANNNFSFHCAFIPVSRNGLNYLWTTGSPANLAILYWNSDSQQTYQIIVVDGNTNINTGLLVAWGQVNVLSVSSDPTAGLTVTLNGTSYSHPAALVTAAPINSTSRIGFHANTVQGSHIHFLEVGYYNQPHSAQNITDVQSYLGRWTYARTLDSLEPAVFFLGHSLMHGYPQTIAFAPPRQAMFGGTGPLDTAGDQWMAVSTVGDNVSLGATRVTNYIAPNVDPARPKNVLVLWMFSNDIAAGRSASTIYSDTLATVAAFRANDSHGQVVVCTEIDRNSGWPAGGRTTVAALNTLFRNGVGTDFDAVADLAARSEFSDATNTTYFYTDQVHLTTTGYPIAGQVIQTAVAGLPAVTRGGGPISFLSHYRRRRAG